VEERFEARRFTADVERHNLVLAHAEFLQTEKQTCVGQPRKACDGDGLALEISRGLDRRLHCEREIESPRGRHDHANGKTSQRAVNHLVRRV
jgi:hypothetical protein